MSSVNFGYDGNCLDMNEKALDRFWSKVDIRGDDECWEWQGYLRNSSGYGGCSISGRSLLSHRVSFTLNSGYEPDYPSLVVCHNCNNPLCCNPNHLRADTHRSNYDDMVKVGNAVDRVGSKNGRSKITENDVLEIRDMYAKGMTQREIAGIVSVGKSMVSYIVNGDYWTHI